MLKKFISIKNVGRFRNSATSGNPQLAKHTVISGANGFGKTTICAILRSLNTGDASHVVGRRTLGAEEKSSIEMLLQDGPAHFDGVKWNSQRPRFAIFDGTFVAENIYSGEVVDLEHKRNLYRVIIGETGVKLAESDAALAAARTAKNAELNAISKSLQVHVPEGMTVADFVTLQPNAKIDEEISEQERTVEVMRQADVVRNRAALSEYNIPSLPVGLKELFGKTIENVANDAEGLLAAHLLAHGMSDSGAGWIAEGLKAARDTCPFCGQGITGLQLISAFRAVFSESYKALASDVSAAAHRLGQQMGDLALARLATAVEQNKASFEFWQRYCSIDGSALSIPSDIESAVRSLEAAAKQLLTQKAHAPLDVVELSTEFTVAENRYNELLDAVRKVNDHILIVNGTIAAKKAEANTDDLKKAQATLSRLKAIKKRYEPEIVALVDRHTELAIEKFKIETDKEEVRRKLDAHTNTVVKPYELRINHYLSAFNAGFRIAETKHAYPGGVATSSYQLVINDVPIPLGDSKTPASQASFKNTLSAGDRTTLALAFFLAHLERDAEVGGKIVVFDDPFNSQDSFRRRQTVHEIIKVAAKAAQVIVLSHDPTFLKQVWDKSPPNDRVSLAITDHRTSGSKIASVDLDEICRGRTATDTDHLQAYMTTGAGQSLDIIRKMRVVLETYCRTTYPSSFLPADWLGDIVRKIREGGAAHPASSLYEDLDQINDYTSQYHHGEDVADTTPDQIDPNELSGYVGRTLRIVNT
jgi:wobble nucleotide-excising tRNase